MNGPATGFTTALFLSVFLLASHAAHASTADEIAALEAAKIQPGWLPALPDFGIPEGRALSRPPTPVMLTSGRKVNLNDYALVVFMQQHCPYSAKFDPKIKSWAEEKGMKIYAYTLDGNGDAAFPVPMVPRKAGPNEPLAGEILTFFSNGLPIATPTTFMVNVNTNAAYPLIQGDTDMATLGGRVSQMIEADVDNLPPDSLGPVPTSHSSTAQ